MSEALDLKPRRDTWVLSAAENAAAAQIYMDSVASIFEIALHDEPANFHNSLDSFHLGAALFGRSAGVGQSFNRTRRHIARDGLGHIQVLLALRGGWSGYYDGRFADRTMGQVRIMDMGRPFEVQTSAFESLHLVIPRGALNVTDGRDLHGLVLDEGNSGVALLIAHMRTLWDCAPDLTVREGVSGVGALTTLVEGAIRRCATPVSIDPRPFDLTLLAMARQWIDAAPAGPLSNPEGLRAHLGVSRSTLYRLLEPDGGAAAFIQGRRLNTAFLMLVEITGNQRSIAEIGYTCGFNSPPHFSRVFRNRFGITPGELRSLRSRSGSPPGALKSDPPSIMKWLRQL